MKICRLLPLPLCLVIAQAWAGAPIHLSHDASPTTHLSISNVKGSVTITGWDRNAVEVGGELGSGARPLTITGSNDRLTVKVQPEGGSGWFSWGGDNRMGPTTLEIHVPRAASVAVNVVSAPLHVDGLAGGTIDIHSVSGRIGIHARTPSLKVESVSGNIEQTGYARSSDLQTVSGSIDAPNLGDDARLQTISGRLQFKGGPWHKLDVSTVSGNVQLHGALAANGTIGIDSMSGDVQMQLPAQTSATLHASSFSGDLHSDFGTPERAEHGPGSTLDSRLGKGQGSIKVETFSGDLRIGKQG